MKTKAKSVQVYEVRLWSPSHYGQSTKNKWALKIYDGLIIDAKTKEKKHFHSVAELLTALEKMFVKAEQKNK
jgi:hypothetical protein